LTSTDNLTTTYKYMYTKLGPNKQKHTQYYEKDRQSLVWVSE